MKDLRNMPKIELHVHLDGSMRVATASELSGQDINFVRDKMVASSACLNLNDYLTKFDFPISLLQKKENLIRVAKELVEDLENDGVIYAEVRFAPSFHISKGLNLEEVINSVLEGLSFGNIRVNVILCMMRNMSFDENKKIIDLAKKYINKGVVGIDLAGAEAIYKTESFKELFEYASKLCIPFTIHAGEAAGKESVKAALLFGSKRIGHGVRVIEDDNLSTEIVDKNICLEVCPTSNIQTRVFSEYSKHIIYDFYKRGVLVSVNTDNRTVSNITLTEEYEKLLSYFPFNLDDLKKMNLNAIEASFISNEQKMKLKKKYLEKFNKYIS